MFWAVVAIHCLCWCMLHFASQLSTSLLKTTGLLRREFVYFIINFFSQIGLMGNVSVNLFLFHCKWYGYYIKQAFLMLMSRNYRYSIVYYSMHFFFFFWSLSLRFTTLTRDWESDYPILFIFFFFCSLSLGYTTSHSGLGEWLPNTSQHLIYMKIF